MKFDIAAAEINASIEELYKNEFHPIGKCKITLDTMIQMRDEFSIKLEKAV